MQIIVTISPVIGSDSVGYVVLGTGTPELALLAIRCYLSREHSAEDADNALSGGIAIECMDDANDFAESHYLAKCDQVVILNHYGAELDAADLKPVTEEFRSEFSHLFVLQLGALLFGAVSEGLGEPFEPRASTLHAVLTAVDPVLAQIQRWEDEGAKDAATRLGQHLLQGITNALAHLLMILNEGVDESHVEQLAVDLRAALTRAERELSDVDAETPLH